MRVKQPGKVKPAAKKPARGKKPASHDDNAGKLAQQIRDAFALVNYNGKAFRDARINEEFLTARLDELIPQNVHIHLVKIDVEGGEFQVLKGGVETVRHNRPFIVFEFGLGGADWYGIQPEDMYRLLSGYGLDVSLMSDWLSGKTPLGEREFAAEFRDCRNYYFLAHPHG